LGRATNAACLAQMPELPEVETTRRGLAPHVERQKVTAVRLYDRRLRWPVPKDLPQKLMGRTIDRIDRRSKYLLFRIGPNTLIVHLGMTGSLRVYRDRPPKGAHDHLDIEFGNGALLRYRDPRRFGAVLWSPRSDHVHPLLAKLGPEPFSAEFSADHLFHATRSRGVAIKLALMDNHLVVGVGNIYANEALFRAGIHPTRPANRIAHARFERLVAAIRETLTAAIAKGGSTLRDYVDSAGQPGYFQLDYFVYGRTGQPCRVCGTAVRSTRQGGRSTMYCPACQR
jgi:formamidopyrimidine-DNA glycosylase